MNFTSNVSEPFCEGRIRGIPEYWNAFSSLFISLVMYAGLKTKNLNEQVKTIYFILFLNGIFSMLFHWTMYYGWKMFDQFTMIFAIWFGLRLCMNLCQYKTNIPTYLLHSSNVVVLVLSTCEYDKIFRMFFTVEALFLIYFYKVLTGDLHFRDYYKLGRKGLIISLLAGLFWIITEFYCNKYLILGHSVWHLGISYGMHLLLQFVNSINTVLPVVTRQIHAIKVTQVFKFVPILGDETI